MNKEELLVLRKTFTDLLEKDFVKVNRSLTTALILLVHKLKGKVRFYVDYKSLNTLTTKNRYPFPLIKETLKNLSRAYWFIKLNVVAVFYKIRIVRRKEWKTVFKTRYGLYKWKMMPFGLTKTFVTFQRYINHTLKRFLNDFVSIYIDDVIIYSDDSLADHRRKMQKMLQTFLDAGLYYDIKKNEFEV